jgi:RHS repeat-associated protein
MYDRQVQHASLAHKFNGKERDAETGNDDFGARSYTPGFGRFLSPDWSAIPAPVPYADLTNPQSLNQYAFVKDNPVAFSDPSGHLAEGQIASSDGMYVVPRMRGGGDSIGIGDAVEPGVWEITVNGETTFALGTYDDAYTQTLAREFQAVWNAYPDHKTYDSGKAGTSGKSIQELTGVDVVDTCALRMSYALNQAGFNISKDDGKSAMQGKDGQYYLVAVADVAKFITKTFAFQPQRFGAPKVADFAQTAGHTSGFVRFSISFVGSNATGHVALYSNGSFRDPDYDNYTIPYPSHYAVRGIDYWRMQ